MKFLTPSSLLLVFALAFPANATAQEPAIPPPANDPNPVLTWSGRNGRSIQGRFVRMSGDVVVIDQDAREIQLSATLMTDESAKQARRLAGIEEPPVPAAAPPPIRLQFQEVVASRLETDGAIGRRLAPGQKKLSHARFRMGSPADEPGRGEFEPEHIVRLKRDFLLKTTEVTWDEWNAVRDRAANYGYIDLSPGTIGQGGGTDGTHPVLGITWWDAVKWCNLLSQIENRNPVYHTHPSLKDEFVLRSGSPVVHADWNADGYRLPTEAEWELACRPGTSKRAFHTGPIKETGIDPVDRNLASAGWFGGNSGGKTHPVRQKRPNNIGLYDMHGNAAEWCWDYFDVLPDGEADDPRGPEIGTFRVIRGGSWSDPASTCRAASRSSRNPAAMPNPFVGFRPARNLPTPATR